MFSGIVEALGTVNSVTKEKGNLQVIIRAPFAKELKIDQSISHNGACLTVVKRTPETYSVTAIKETLQKTNLGLLKKGDLVNLERSLKVGDRLDGHIVQGHVDTTAVCKSIKKEKGSWVATFKYEKSKHHITVEKGSVCVNGVSLTVIDSKENKFSVAIIPYTLENTNFKRLKPGDTVNIEFDIVGKYLAKFIAEK
jgi:riboflavin synthase